MQPDFHHGLLEGKQISNRVHQRFKDHYEARNAKKRVGRDVSLTKADRSGLKKDKSGSWKDRGETVTEPRKLGVSERMSEVLNAARKNKKWGAKAAEAFRHYLDGRTEQEAAKLAGITDKTFRNYILRLRRNFTC